MNIYGDTGNIIALKKRAEWRGIEVEIKNISIKDKLEKRGADLFFFGGGQDQAQELVAQDLVRSGKGKIIKEEIERGVPLLSICGGYQLLGEYYQPHQGPRLPGVGLFPTYTIAGDKRMIGNIIVKVNSDQWLVNSEKETKTPFTIHHSPITNYLLVGFENHSGKTYLKSGAQSLGKVVKGFGNNGEDQTEGCIYKNAIGCYMHGSLLPKNPYLADWLLKKALEGKYGKKVRLKPLDDELETRAHQAAIARFG